MAKYDVTYSCGHSATVQLYGPGKERERKIEWMAQSGLCPECYKADQEAKHAAAASAAAEQSAAAGLPALTGTPKQIAWAETIRAQTIAVLRPLERTKSEINAMGKAAMAAGASQDTLKTIATAIIAASATKIAEIKAESRAAWWIDNRDGGVAAILAAAEREAAAREFAAISQ